MNYTFKLIIAGDGGVGKTTLVNRYVNGTFIADTRLTVGVQFMIKRLELHGDVIALQIWDFGGQDRFRFILPAYCRGAHGAIFMYDTTSLMTLHHIDEWINVVRSQANIPVVASGTKIDLVEDRAFAKEEALEVASQFGITDVIEVSSKTGVNVDALFESICTQMKKITQQSLPDRALRNMAQVPSISTPRVN